MTTVASAVKTLRSSDGTVIYAEAVGNPENPHVVFIHEVTLCSAVYDEVFLDRRMTDHLYLVRYDLRCHGRSGIVIPEDGQHSLRHAEDFSTVISAFGLRNPIIVAWGFGATVVGDICASASHNPISGVVFIAPLLFLDPRMPRAATAQMLALMHQLRSSQDTVISARAKTELMNCVFTGPVRQVPGMLRSAWLGYSIAQPPEATRAILASRHDPSGLLESGRQGLPLMLLLGSNDALVDCPAVINELRRHFNNAEAHVVEGGSHALFFDEHAEFVKLLLVFVGRLAPLQSLCFVVVVARSASRAILVFRTHAVSLCITALYLTHCYPLIDAARTVIHAWHSGTTPPPLSDRAGCPTSDVLHDRDRSQEPPNAPTEVRQAFDLSKRVVVVMDIIIGKRSR
ncbi:hypothetical protein BN946_scf184473.g11 [Trametes cinnabarina]|uniref:AB hydrolase-1 domain-containing protein n=1 Tax=Pycnoporus cinnabarinus TaxID=5643 RepID=A0A060SR82_PYCCI|nr:hypothetical protein BN946_scf184473.g11 [Trametes cinnabarina]